MMFCADHGVAAQGVSVFPPETTFRVAKAAAQGNAAVSVFAKQVACDLRIIDMGIRDFEPTPGVVDLRIGNGTDNFIHGAAMSHRDAEQSIINGFRAASDAMDGGYQALAIGEVGNSNTTVASALLSALTMLPPEETVGRGTGVSDVVLMKKIAVVMRALEKNKPDRGDPIDCLAKVGGFELGGMAGAVIGAAANGIPCVVDGFISTVSALIAVRLRPEVRPYLIFSHTSAEQGHHQLLNHLKGTPLLDLELRLGEGTGALAALPMLDIACAMIYGISTFDECGIPSPYDETQP
jgi:nicotinate-nucleotide--dimethylbenzimidazole phosphoribosyltransferase